MDVECWHCFEPLAKHFVKGDKLLCNKIDKKTNKCDEYLATQDILDDEDLYSEVVIGNGKHAKDYALMPINQSMIVKYNDVSYQITKKSSTNVITKPITPTITEKIRRSKCEGKSL